MSNARLNAVRRRMLADRVDALWVRSTDRYLNEYVPRDESTRVWLSRFSGSMGEALVTAQSASVFVDGRYWLQAEQEVSSEWCVVRVPHGRGIDEVVRDRLVELGAVTVGLEADRWTLQEYEALRAELPDGTAVKLLQPSPVQLAREELEPPVHPEVRESEGRREGEEPGSCGCAWRRSSPSC